MRDKENADDYRYFPEPDLAPIILSDEYIENIRKDLPELPESRKKRYLEDYELSLKASNIVTSSKYYSNIFEDAIKVCNNPKSVGNWIISDIARILNEKWQEPDEIPFSGTDLGELVKLIDDGKISSAIAKKVLEEMFEGKETNPNKIVEKNGWIQISDESAILDVVTKILDANPQSIADFKAGKDRALGFLVGQAMKETKGKANPQLLNKMFKEEIDKR